MAGQQTVFQFFMRRVDSRQSASVYWSQRPPLWTAACEEEFSVTKSNRPANQERDKERLAALRAEAESVHTRRRAASGKEDAPPPRRSSRRLNRWLFRMILFVILVIAILALLPRIGALLRPSLEIDLPDSMGELLPDETMGYSKFDFSDAILGESREKSDFVVLEQDVSVASRVSQALANLALFEKSQVVRSYGTGVYTVDLSRLSEDDVSLDEAALTVTIAIPHAKLSYVTVDVEKTEYEETKKALFAFGEIKLTNEQMGLLQQSIEDAMRVELESADMLQKADAYAVSQTQQLFEPIVRAVASEFMVRVVLQDE